MLGVRIWFQIRLEKHLEQAGRVKLRGRPVRSTQKASQPSASVRLSVHRLLLLLLLPPK